MVSGQNPFVRGLKAKMRPARAPHRQFRFFANVAQLDPVLRERRTAGSGSIVTLTGAVIGAKVAATTCGVRVETNKDNFATSPTTRLGGQITGVSLAIPAADRVPAETRKELTVSFTTQTALANTNTVTITLPTSYISGTIGVKVPIGFTATNTGTLPVVVFAASATVNAGALVFTLTGAVIGAKVGAVANGIKVVTTNDLEGTGASLALGGQVQSVLSRDSCS
jgi:hypothetical protein